MAFLAITCAALIALTYVHGIGRFTAEKILNACGIDLTRRDDLDRGCVQHHLFKPKDFSLPRASCAHGTVG